MALLTRLRRLEARRLPPPELAAPLVIFLSHPDDPPLDPAEEQRRIDAAWAAAPPGATYVTVWRDATGGDVRAVEPPGADPAAADARTKIYVDLDPEGV
jgi:hypothetical protein